MFGSESEHGTRPLVEVLPVHRALIELDGASVRAPASPS